MNDQQLRAWLDKHFTDEQLKKLGLSLAETIAEGRLEADLEEALGGTAPVDLWPDIGDATWAWLFSSEVMRLVRGRAGSG